MTATSRHAGIVFAVGWFLVALGAGAMIPRLGRGLFNLINDSPCPACLKISFLFSGAWLIVSSFSAVPWIRISAALLGLICWLLLAFMFVHGELWGAAIQAFVAITLLNGCFFHAMRSGES